MYEIMFNYTYHDVFYYNPNRWLTDINTDPQHAERQLRNLKFSLDHNLLTYHDQDCQEFWDNNVDKLTLKGESMLTLLIMSL